MSKETSAQQRWKFIGRWDLAGSNRHIGPAFAVSSLGNLDFVQHIDRSLTYKGAKLECGYRIDLI